MMRPALVALLWLSAASAFASARQQAAAPMPVPPDPEAITVFGRYQPSLESLAPAGVEIGDLAVRDGRLVVHVRAKSS